MVELKRILTYPHFVETSTMDGHSVVADGVSTHAPHIKKKEVSCGAEEAVNAFKLYSISKQVESFARRGVRRGCSPFDFECPRGHGMQGNILVPRIEFLGRNREEAGVRLVRVFGTMLKHRFSSVDLRGSTLEDKTTRGLARVQEYHINRNMQFVALPVRVVVAQSDTRDDEFGLGLVETMSFVMTHVPRLWALYSAIGTFSIPCLGERFFEFVFRDGVVELVACEQNAVLQRVHVWATCWR